jgi:hypothetical protein
MHSLETITRLNKEAEVSGKYVTSNGPHPFDQ